MLRDDVRRVPQDILRYITSFVPSRFDAVVIFPILFGGLHRGVGESVLTIRVDRSPVRFTDEFFEGGGLSGTIRTR